MSSIDDHYKKKPEGLIYHYTTQKGLLGIIQEKELWCTNILYLNDSSEFNYAYDLFDKILKKEIQEKQDLEKMILEFLKNIFFSKTKTISPDTSSDPISDLNQIYVCSFCNDTGDTLSQWRGYCKPNISGFSIGFGYDQIKNLFEWPSLSIGKCIYKEDEQVLIVKKIIEEMLNALKLSPNLSSYLTGNHDDDFTKISEFPKMPENKKRAFGIILSFILKLHEIASFFKHVAFEDEKEWRIVKIGRSGERKQFDCREGKSMLIPYYKFKLAHNKNDQIIIDRIVIGPTPHRELSKISLENFLMLHNVKCHKIDFSNIPYRDW